MPLQLFSRQYCINSQRILIALRESEVEVEYIVVSDDSSLSPEILSKGIYPVLKDGEDIKQGNEEVFNYLEKHPKVGKLSQFKKKKVYVNALHHAQIMENSFEVAIMKRIPKIPSYTAHIETILESFKGPYYLGSALSWLDIYYWTVFERLQVLEYDITDKTIQVWMDRLTAMPSFIISKYDTEELYAWYRENFQAAQPSSASTPNSNSNSASTTASNSNNNSTSASSNNNNNNGGNKNNNNNNGKNNNLKKSKKKSKRPSITSSMSSVLPKFDPTLYLCTVNKALKEGIEELLHEIGLLQMKGTLLQAQEVVNKFRDFDLAFQELSKSKVFILFKSFDKDYQQQKEKCFTKERCQEIEKEHKTLDHIHSILSSLISNLNIKIRINKKKDKLQQKQNEKSSNVSQGGRNLSHSLSPPSPSVPTKIIKQPFKPTPPPFHITKSNSANNGINKSNSNVIVNINTSNNNNNNNSNNNNNINNISNNNIDIENNDQDNEKYQTKIQSQIRLLEQQLLFAERKNGTTNDLIVRLKDTVIEFQATINENINNEETNWKTLVQSDVLNEKIEEDENAQMDLLLLVKRLFSSSTYHQLKIIFPWVICHLLDIADQHYFLLTLKISMAFRYTVDVMEWMEMTLPNNIWTNISGLFDTGGGEEDLWLFDSSSEGPLSSSESDGNISNSGSNNDESNSRESGSSVSSSFSMMVSGKKRGSTREKRKDKPPKKKGDKEDKLKLTKSDSVLNSYTTAPPPADPLYPLSYYEKNNKGVNPLCIFYLTKKVMKMKIHKLEDIIKTSPLTLFSSPTPPQTPSSPNRNIDEYLDLLVYINIKDLQDDLSIFPFLSKTSNEFAKIVKVFETDHKNHSKIIRQVFNQFNTIKDLSPPQSTPIPPLFEEFIAEISRAIILIKHTLWKEDTLFIPLVEKLISDDVQSRIVREVFDISPLPYFSRVIPWTYRNLSEEDQGIFVECLKSSLAKPQFDVIYSGIKKISAQS